MVNNNDNTEQLISSLLQYDISDKMIGILQKQHITDEDLYLMDRDDVEHLFKNQDDFTFRDRKHFWNTLQKIQSTSISTRKVEEMMDSPEVLEQIYRFAEEDFEITDTKSEESPRSSSHTTDRHTAIISLFDDKQSNDDEDNHSIPSSPKSELSLSSDYVFTYPSILPSFSANVTHALKTNTIHKQWSPFINELARWVMSIKPCLREQHEYRAIGQTLYEKYPNIGTAGPKPWSFLCRSLSQRIRTERWQRRKMLVARKRKDDGMAKMHRSDDHIQAEIIL